MIIDELFEAPQQCPECGGISFSDLILAEKKDACYHKVKASAKVWPSAYASGRLVQCRKKGAANYGKSKTESVSEGSKMARADKSAKTPKPKDQQEYDDVEKYRKDLAQSYNKEPNFGIKDDEEENKWWIDYDLDEGVAEGSLEEVSQQTLQSYRKKASAQKRAADDVVSGDADDETWKKNVSLSAKRRQGIDAANKRLGVAEGSGPQVGDAVYYGKRLVGWFKGYSEHGKIITEPNYEEMGDEYANRDVYWDPQDKITIKPEQGMAETRRGQIPMTLKPGETDNLEPEDFAGFKKLPAYQQGQAAQQKAGKQLIQKSPYTFQSDQDWAYRQGATDAQRAAMFANFGGTKPLTTAEGEQQPGADYRDPKEVDYDGEYDAMVARVKKLAGLGPMKTVYDPNKRQYRNMPTAVQPKK